MPNATHNEKLARAKALLGKHYLLHPDNKIQRKAPPPKWRLDPEGRTALDDALDDPRHGQAAALNGGKTY